MAEPTGVPPPGQSERAVRNLMDCYGIGPGSHHSLADLDLLERWRAHRTGLAPYYPLLYSLVIGMGAQRVFEFGMGESSAVLREALEQTGGTLVSCSPEPLDDRGGSAPSTTRGNWTLWHQDSATTLRLLAPGDPIGPNNLFDLVLHDGSHSADVVAADLLAIILRMKEGGLILVHDVLHSYVGEQMRRGVLNALTWRDGAQIEIVPHRMLGLVFKEVTLPFAFGLHMIQVTGTGNAPVSLGPDKPTSPHRTLRITEIEDR